MNSKVKLGLVDQHSIRYSLFFEFPATWSIDDKGLRKATKDIRVIPPVAKVPSASFSILIDDRTLKQIQEKYAEMPDIEMVASIIASQKVIQLPITNCQPAEY